MPKMHRVGACTWMFGNMALEEIARRLEKVGLDGVELMGDLALYGPRKGCESLPWLETYLTESRSRLKEMGA